MSFIVCVTLLSQGMVKIPLYIPGISQSQTDDLTHDCQMSSVENVSPIKTLHLSTLNLKNLCYRLLSHPDLICRMQR